MIEPMGPSAKLAVIATIVAAGLLVLTGLTLAMPVFLAFVGVLALAYLACVLELVLRRRHVVLIIGGLATSVALACSLAFLGTWGLASDDTRSVFRTPLPTTNTDNYFYGAGLALVFALLVLFVGAIWRAPRRRSQKGPQRRSRQAATGATTARTAATRPATNRPAPSQPRRAQPRR